MLNNNEYKDYDRCISCGRLVFKETENNKEQFLCPTCLIMTTTQEQQPILLSIERVTMKPGKAYPILLGPKAIRQEFKTVTIYSPLGQTCIDCLNMTDASRVARSLRRYVNVVDVNCSLEDITRMIDNAGVLYRQFNMPCPQIVHCGQS